MTPPADNARRCTGWWAAAAIFAVLGALIAVRAMVVDRRVGAYIACDACFHVDVFLADLMVLGTLASLLLLASSSRSRAFQRIPHIVCGIVLLVYTADVIVFALYNSRLLMTNIVLYLPEGAAIWDQFSTGLGGTTLAAGVLAGFAALFTLLWWMPAVPTRGFRLSMSFLLAVSLTTSAFFKGAPFVNNWAIENVFAVNMATPTRNPYSPEEARRILSREVTHATWRAATPPARGRNVIMVVIEYWSAWHSALFGGFEDWTPELDRAARRGMRFDNFHSVGFASDEGLVAILGGQQICAPFLHWFETPPFHSMWGIEDNLPGAFNPAGYHTAFLTTGPLAPNQKGEWLQDLGFDETEGKEHPFYAGLPRFATDAASDQVLHDRASQWMQTAPAPWFLVLETVTTHPPYIDPESGERSIEKAVKYADRAFGAFLQGLDARGFFDNGVLIVLSDHRSMTPLFRRELDLWGPDAHSRIPAFIIGNEFEAGTVAESVFSQSDLRPSFEWWASGEVTLDPFEAVMFDPAFEGHKCAFHERGDRRGVVEVICDDGRGQVILDGDHTRFSGATNLSPARQEEALQVLGRERLEALQRHQTTTEG